MAHFQIRAGATLGTRAPAPALMARRENPELSLRWAMPHRSV